MNNQQIWNKIEKLGETDFPFENTIVELQTIKKKAVENNLQKEAKEIWICQTIIGIHQLYSNVFNLLKEKQYYKAWCQLERTEITISSLKRHFSFSQNKYLLSFIEKSVANLQVIYPYNLFASMEIVKTSILCSVCKKKHQLEIHVVISLEKFIMEKCVIE